MNHTDSQYLDTLRRLLTHGDHREGRNGGVRSLFGHQMRFDLARSFPLLTSKSVNFHAITVELLWFLRGDTNVKFLHDHGVHIWDEWANASGDLGPVYGKQWRSWPTVGFYGEGGGPGSPIDQVQNVLDGLKVDPYGRRHIITAWNPAEVGEMALPPCHCLFQFHVSGDRLNCQLYQRSADWFLGVPFNIASYALLTHLVAREVGLEVGEFIHTFGDYHLYDTHVEQAWKQLAREVDAPASPQLTIGTDERGIFELDCADFILTGYAPMDAIKAKVSA